MAEQVLVALEAHLPLAFERAVTYGDYTLDNALMLDGRVTGCIDVARVGTADPWQVFTLLWHALADFGCALQQVVSRASGIAEPDERKSRLHVCLDELF